MINFGGLAGLTTVVMVMMLGQTRVLFAMSRDGLMPRGLAKTGKKGTPVRITVVVGGVVALLAAFFPMGTLEEMVNIGTLFAFVLVCIGVIVLRRTRPDLPRGFRVPLVPLRADPRGAGLRVADAEPVGGDLDPVPRLDGARRRRLLRLRPAQVGPRPAARRTGRRRPRRSSPELVQR